MTKTPYHTMRPDSAPHVTAVVTALLVTLLWSTPWVARPAAHGGRGGSTSGIALPVGQGVGIAVVLAGVLANTAVAFTLWNRALRLLSALQATVLNGTMLIQIALLARVFLGEPRSAPECGAGPGRGRSHPGATASEERRFTLTGPPH